MKSRYSFYYFAFLFSTFFSFEKRVSFLGNPVWKYSFWVTLLFEFRRRAWILKNCLRQLALWQPGIDAPCRACSRFTMMVLVHMIIFRYKRMFCSFYILFCRLPNKSFSSFTQPCFHKELLPSWVCSEAPSSPSSWRPTHWVGRLQKGSDAPRGRKMSWTSRC